MILLDTNALLWMLVGHERARPVLETASRLYLSPVSLLELAFLKEIGRLHEAPGRSLKEVEDDPRWELDDPSSATLVRASLGLSWTRDPFDRLLVAHSRLRNWRLATGDRALIAALPPEQTVTL